MDAKITIGAEISALCNLIKRQAKMQNGGIEADITHTQGIIIGFLMQHPGGVLQRDIEGEFSARSSTISRTLKLMEKRGLIVRRYMEHDARLKTIVLTDKARQGFEEISWKIDQLEAKLIRGISPEQLDTFHTVLAMMQENLKD